MDSDAALVKGMRQGDAEAFDRFVRAHYNDILSYCSRHCLNPEDAKNLTQDVFLLFFKHLSQYRHIGKVKPYLYTIAKHCCINHARKQQAIPVETKDLESLHVAHPIDSVVDELTLQAYIDRLSDEYAQVVELYYLGDMQVRAIAQQLNISIPTVKYRLHQARQHLRRLLVGSQEQETHHD